MSGGRAGAPGCGHLDRLDERWSAPAVRRCWNWPTRWSSLSRPPQPARPGEAQRGSGLLAALATLEVALELAGDRLAGGLGELGGVAGLLEGAHVVGDILVLLGELVDAALPGARLLGEV